MKCFDKSILEKLRNKKREKQLIALINSADMYCTVHLSYDEKKATEKRNHKYTYRHIHIHSNTDTCTQTYMPRTKTLNERTVWKINSFYRKIEEKQWNTISNDKWHKILQVTVTEEEVVEVKKKSKEEERK